jgi:DNA repair exonuclease SbcCD nuclease subunit
LYILGDTHGNWKHILWMVKQKGIKDTTIYHVGDIEVGFIAYDREMENLEWLNEQFKKFNIVFYGIRGNHDNPYFFDGTVNMTNLKLLADYTLVNIEGKGVLGVGGATSIDRRPRIVENEANIRYGNDKKCYWTGEKFILDEDKLEELKPGDVDIVVTHTAPAFCYPRNDNGFAPIVDDFARNDGKLKTELTIERGKLNQMYELLNKTQTLDKWFYGHFHKHEITLEGNTEFVCLDINQLYDIVDYTDYEKEMNEKYGE